MLNPGDAGIAEAGPIADVANLPGRGYDHLNMTTPTRPSSALSISFDAGRWSRYSDGRRLVLEAAAMAQSHIVAAQAMKRNAVAKQVFSISSAVSVGSVPEPLFADMMDQCRSVFEGIEALDQAGAIVVDDYRRFAERVQVWTRVAEGPFTLARRRTASQA